MYDFAYKLFNVSLPRVRDFRGVSKNSFDGRGNYSMGIKEQLIFPEIEYDKIDKIRGMDIIFVTTAKTDEEAKRIAFIVRNAIQKLIINFVLRCQVAHKKFSMYKKYYLKLFSLLS